MKRKAIFFQCAALLVLTSAMCSAIIPISGEYLLPVPGKEQKRGNWCWAAVSEAVLEYYGKTTYDGQPITQQIIAAYGTPGQDNATNDLFQAVRPNHGVDEILAYFGGIYSLGVYSPVPGSDVVESIQNLRRPMPIGLRDFSGLDHMIVIIGVRYDSQTLDLHIMDPADGTKFWLSYDKVVYNSYYQWIETLTLQRLVTMPDEAVSLDTTIMNPQNKGIISNIDLPAILSNTPDWDGVRLYK